MTLAGRDVRAVGATNVAFRSAMATVLQQQAGGKVMTKCARLLEQVRALESELASLRATPRRPCGWGRFE